MSGKAAVEIVGDLNDFGGKLERDLNNELRDVDLDSDKIGKKLADDVGDGARKAGDSIDGLEGKARESLKGVGDEADKAGDTIGDSVTKGTDRARDSLGRFTKSSKKSSRDFALGFLGLPAGMNGIGKLAGKALLAGFAGLAVAQSVTTASAIIAALGPAVGAVGPLSAALIAAKIAAGTFSLAMMGVADAVSAGLTGDTAKFNDALKDMPVTAQQAVKEIVSLKKEILGVREVVQGNFFGQLVGSIKPLGALYLPMVANQLGRISSGFGKAAASTSAFLQSPAAVARVNAALTDTGTAVNNVTAGVPGLVKAFLPLWQVAASFLPSLTAEFDTLTQKFADFVTQAADSGQLQEFFSNGLSALGDLLQLLGSLGSIIGSIFRAMQEGGTGAFAVIGQALAQFAAFLKTAEGFSALTSVFSLLAQVGGLFGQALGIVLPVVGQLVAVLAGALAPVIPVISSAMSQLAPVLAQVGAILGAALVPVISTVAQLFATLVPVIMPIVQALLGALLPAVQALAPIIAALGTTIGSILSTALQALLPLFLALLPVVQQIAADVLPSLLPLIASLGQLFIALMPAIQPVIDLLIVMINSGLKQFTTVMPLVLSALNWLIQALTAIVGPIATAIGWVANFLSTLLQGPKIAAIVVAGWNMLRAAVSAVFSFIRSFITSVINSVKAVLRSVGGVVNSVIGFFGRMRAMISSALSSARAAVSSAVSAIIGFFSRLASGASSAIGRMVGVVRGIGGRIRGAVGNLAGLLVSAGRNVIQGLINGITSKLGALRAKASSAASTIRNLFPFSPAKEGPLSGSGSPEIAGGKIATMVAAGLEKRIPAIRAAAFKAADSANLGGVDFAGRGILSSALGSRSPSPAFKPNPSSTGVTFAPGAINLNFYGPPPSPEQAYAAGEAAGRGLASAMQTRGVRTTMRTI